MQDDLSVNLGCAHCQFEVLIGPRPDVRQRLRERFELGLLAAAATAKNQEAGGDYWCNAHWHEVSSNDEVERRGVAPTQDEGSLSRSSIPSMAQRRHNPAIARAYC